MKLNINTYKNVSADKILYTMVKEHLKLELGFENKVMSNLATESLIGICLPSTFGAELMGIEFVKTYMNKYSTNTKIVFFLPFPEHIFLNEPFDEVYIKKGCFITNNLTIQQFEITKPLLLNRVFFEGYKENAQFSKDNEVYSLTQSKRLSYLFFRKHHIPTTKSQELVRNMEDLYSAIKKVTANGKHDFVVKSVYGWGGYGVKMFNNITDNNAIEFSQKLFADDNEIIVERRITSFPLIINNRLYDWNIRLLIGFDNSFNPIIDLKLAHARIKTFNNEPIGYEIENAPQVLVSIVFNNLALTEKEIHTINDNLIDFSYKIGENFVNEIPSKGLHKYPTFLALDIILDKNQKWRVIEINTGNVGDIPCNIELYQYNTEILKNYVIGFSKYLPKTAISNDVLSRFELNMLRQDYINELLYFAKKSIL